MFRHRLIASVVFVAGIAALAGLARADNLNVDPVHSFVLFNVQHMKAGYVWGRFDGPTGSIAWDDSDLSKTSISISVDVSKLDTGAPGRDDDLKGPNYFNAAQFPTMTFKSTAIKKIADDKYEVTGDLTLHGTAKSITVTIEKTGTGKGFHGETRTGWETSFSIKRSEYGMPVKPEVAGDEVRIMVALEGIQQ